MPKDRATHRAEMQQRVTIIKETFGFTPVEGKSFIETYFAARNYLWSLRDANPAAATLYENWFLPKRRRANP